MYNKLYVVLIAESGLIIPYKFFLPPSCDKFKRPLWVVRNRVPLTTQVSAFGLATALLHQQLSGAEMTEQTQHRHGLLLLPS